MKGVAEARSSRMKNHLPDPLVLAIDIGSSSTRSAVFDAIGGRVPGSFIQQPYTLQTDMDGRAELDPDELLEAVESTIAGALKNAAVYFNPQPISIAAVGVSCFWHSLVGVDGEGEPLTPIFTWADSRCRDEARQLRDELHERQYHRRTGCMLRTSFWPAKLTWIRRADPRLFRHVYRWMSPAEWIESRFCENVSCAFGMATGTGLLNPSELVWDKQMISRCELRPDAMNPLGDLPSEIRVATRERFPALAHASWFPAIGDGAAGNLGCGADRDGIAALNAGTSAAIRLMNEGEKAEAPFGLFCYRVDEARFLVGGAVSNLGNLFAWCQKNLRVPEDPGDLERELSQRRTPSEELTVMPNWTSERAPDWDEAAKGHIRGITASTTALDLMQAIMEASYYRLATIADMLGEAKAYQIILAGGLLHSPSGVQRLADCLGRPLGLSGEPEASLRGAAVFALEKLGLPMPRSRPDGPVKPDRRYAKLHLAKRKSAAKD